MFRLFRCVLPSGRQMARNVNTIPAESFERFCRDEYSAEYFRKSQEAFQKAQAYFESKEVLKAKQAITEAIINGSKVESVGPNSFMLSFFNLQRKIVALTQDDVKEMMSPTSRKS